MKKLMVLAVCLTMLGILAVNSTFAFSFDGLFQTIADTLGGAPTQDESQLRVETLVQMRGKDGLTAESGQMLLPAIYPDGFDWDKKTVTLTLEGKQYSLWNIANAVDKFISVKNAADNENGATVYFRTAISIRCPDDAVWNKLKFNLNTTDFDWSGWKTTDNGQYRTNIATYKDKLEPGQVSPPMMLQIALDKSMTNAQMEQFGTEFEIRINTAAIDTSTFIQAGTSMSAKEALNLALPIDSFLKN